MIAGARDLLWRNLPPQAFEYARSCWRYCQFNLRHLDPSLLTWGTPKVYGFPADRPSQFADELRAINVFTATEMCRVMTRHGSDKGRDRHNYTTVYSALFENMREQPLRIFELGLGTNNLAFGNNMGVNGIPGASLRGWRDLFPHAFIYGADIDRDILFEEDRIKTFYCDQLDSAAIHDLWSEPALNDPMDIIIDDGLHTFEANISFLNNSLEHLALGGIYAAEDILQGTIPAWRNRLETVYTKRFPYHEFALMELPNPMNGGDNNLLVVRRNG